MRTSIAFLLLCTSALFATAQEQPLAQEQNIGQEQPTARLAAPGALSAGRSSLRLANIADNKCMLAVAYENGQVLSAPATQQLKAMAEQCVQFDRGIGAWYIEQKVAGPEPVDTSSPKAEKTLTLFRSGAFLWLSFVLNRCADAQAESAESCYAMVSD
jgi:hypothetical protein